MKLRTLIIALLLSVNLSACVGLAIGGAAVGAASIADRRTTGAQTDDEVMENRIRVNAVSNIKSHTSNTNFVPQISVVSYNRHILLLGNVATQEDKQLAERIARAEKSAQNIYNHITVSTDERTFANASSDSWITSKVRSNLLGISTSVYPGHVKVVTYAGTTYVMGILTQAEQQAVTENVRTTSGVQQVITLYQTFDK